MMARTRVSTRSRNAQLAQEMLACVMAGGWLLAMPSCAQRAPVLAYCEARPNDGGGGAVMVLLQASGDRREARDDTPDE